MPKAQCTTCKKMVPLQILPLHIKECKTEFVDLSSSAEEESCNEEREDELPDSISSQEGKSAECPVCNNAFQADIIEIHAATCGLRPTENDGHESSGSVPVSQISTFQRPAFIPYNFTSIGVLRKSWIGSLYKLMKQTHFPSVCRELTSSAEACNNGSGRRRHHPNVDLRSHSLAGIDTGALSREFLTEMLAEIENRLFVGGPDKKGKNPVYCLNSLDSNYFRSAGEVMAASLAQGRPCPNFTREWCFKYLCSGDSDSILVSASDVTD
ncbi:uncharacterized protein LOC126399950 [Epinephelus moara]|uniref:uncharacterized protein LOC126399950 n=1 Tax=Epinephelus moara TaxID=300413 RepID=UPI00214EB9C4|nr:uncharacterized protein LOC126399950 [Epinephelus moara]